MARKIAALFGWLQREMALLAVIMLASLAWAGFAARADPPPLDVYGRLPGFEDAAISASGRYIAMLATIEEHRLLLVSELDGTPILTLPVEDSQKIRGIDWAGDQAVLVSYSVTSRLPLGFTTDKAELGSVLVLPIDRSSGWAVFDKVNAITGGVRSNFGLVQRGGRWFGYFGGYTVQSGNATGEGYFPLRPDLYEVDLQSRKVRRIAQRANGEQTDRDWLVDANGAVGATLDVFLDNGRWTLTNTNRQIIASGKTQGAVDLVGFTPDGSAVVYATSEAAGGRWRWFSVPLAGGTPQPYLDDADVAGVWMDRARRLTGYTSGRAAAGATFFDPVRNTIYRQLQKAFGDKRISIESASDDFDDLLVKVDGLDDPGTWYRVDVSGHRADPLGYAYPIAASQVGPSRFLSFAAADGLKMEGVLTLPPGRAGKNLPAVIMPHGGPSSHDEPGFDWWAQAYASRGYAVFQPNFRGSTGYGNDFMQAGNGEWGRKMQSDISEGLAELVKQGIVDSKRVAIVGASYGGYAALAGVTLQQGLYRCAVSVSGIADLGRFVNGQNAIYDDPVLAKALKAEIGSGLDLKLVSPIRFVSKVTVPILLIHGKDDTVVPYTQSSAMADALRDAGKPVEFVTLTAEDHWLSKGETRNAMLTAAVGFVQRCNPADSAPAAPTGAKP